MDGTNGNHDTQQQHRQGSPHKSKKNTRWPAENRQMMPISMEHENIRIVLPSYVSGFSSSDSFWLECQREKLRNFLVKFITIRLVTDFQEIPSVHS